MNRWAVLSGLVFTVSSKKNMLRQRRYLCKLLVIREKKRVIPLLVKETSVLSLYNNALAAFK